MWANSFWGFLGFAVTFGVAVLLLGPDQMWLRPWFAGACFVCGIGSALVLFWPLRHANNRIKVAAASKHPFKWIANTVEPLHIIILGLAIALSGVIWQWRRATQPDPRIAALQSTVADLEQKLAKALKPKTPPSQPGQTPAVQSPKEVSLRSVRELLALHEKRSGLEADKLLEPFKGLWIPPAQGTIGVLTSDGGSGGAMVIIRLSSDDAIECHFSSKWVRELSRYKEGDQLRITGRINHFTGGHLIVLTDCETATEALGSQFATRTVRELRALYEGRTRLQADAFMADEKGKLIEVEGTVVNVDSGMAFLKVGNMNDYVECRFGPEWNAKLGTFRQGDHMKIRGTIGPNQNGAQIYLQECEIIP